MGLLESTSGALPTDIGYTGQRLDGTGLMYYNARYYAPYLNRWLQPDTIVPNPGNPQDLNRYSYVRNNPLKYTDDPSASSGQVLNAGLTQVLTDTSNVYLYGNGRIAQYAGAPPSYFLGDALGSVRQLTDNTGGITLAKSYQPYGSVMNSSGAGSGASGASV